MVRFAACLAAALVVAAPALAQDHPVTLTVTFAGDTAATLQDLGEWVTISAYYFGDAASPEAPQEEDGSVYLGGETIQIFPADQTITFASTLAGVPADWTDMARINVNVFTARFAAEDNLIDCGLVEGPLAEIAAAENVVTCSLLGP